MTESLSPIQRVSPRAALVFLGTAFVLTGCAGLLAEQCFEKLLSSLLGASTPAAAVVLSVYFLGLTLGGLLASRRAHRLSNPLRTYAWLEFGVASWSILLIFFAQMLVQAFTPLLKLGVMNFWMLQGLRFGVACIWILPPAILMGATFPVIVAALERMRVPRPRKAMSRFYALNLAGAVLGALAGPYWAFPEVGLSGTLGITALVDGVAAIGVLVLLRRLRFQIPAFPGAAVATTNMEAPGLSAPLPILLLAIGGVSGFLFFGLEVTWTHLIAAVLGNSVYAFAAMLALVLIGLGVGALISALLFRKDRPVPAWMIALLLITGSWLMAHQHSDWPGIPTFFTIWGMGLTEFWQGEVLRWLQAARMLLPTAIVLGMVYPALFRMDVFPSIDRARAAGALGAMNSLGCVLGALGTGFLLIPWLGSEKTLKVLGLLTLICGLSLGIAYTRAWRRWTLLGLAAWTSVGWWFLPAWNPLALTSGGHVYFQRGHVKPTSKLKFFHEDTLGGITTVVEDPAMPSIRGTGMLTLLTNGKFQANDAGEVDAQTGFAIVPILHTRAFEDALVIGLGSGHSAEVVDRMGFKRIDIAEISPGIVEAARTHFSHINGGILQKPHARLILEDGRNHLLLTDRSYDLITMEVSSVWFAGSTSLYCREFYDLAKRRLKPGGIMQQWIQVHHIRAAEVGSVIATMRQSFQHVSFWFVGGQGILVASDMPMALQPDAVQGFMGHNPYSDPTPAAQLDRLKWLLGCRLLAGEDTERLLNRVDFPTNTDSNRFLEYATPHSNLSRLPLEKSNINFLSRFATFPTFVNDGRLPPEILSALREVDESFSRKVQGLGDASSQGSADK